MTDRRVDGGVGRDIDCLVLVLLSKKYFLGAFAAAIEALTISLRVSEGDGDVERDTEAMERDTQQSTAEP